MIRLIIFRGLTGTGKSTVADILVKRYPNLVQLDIDTVRKVNATEEVCFPEAGKQASKEIEKGHVVVAHDAFDSIYHLELFLRAAGFWFGYKSLCIFQLECTLEEALVRNHGKRDPMVKPDQTRQQYKKEMQDVHGHDERIIPTSARTAEEVAEKLAQYIGLPI